MVDGIISERYWLKQLAGDLVKVDIGDSDTNVEQEKCCYDVTIPKQLLDKIQRFIHDNDLGRFCYFITTLQILIYKYTSESEGIIVVPSFVNGETPEDDNVYFLRYNINSAENFKTLLGYNRSLILDCIKHQGVDYQNLIEKLSIRNADTYDQSTFFNIGFKDKSVHEDSLVLNNCNLIINPVIFASEGSILFQYGRNFNSHFISQFAQHYLGLLHKLMMVPDITVDAVDLLSDLEKKELLESFNDSFEEYPIKELHLFLEENSQLIPEHVAVNWKQQFLTYSQLYRQASQLAAYLVNVCQVKPGEIIGVCLDSCLQLPVAIFGILKAGAAVLPVIATDASERIDFILKDSNVKFVIVQQDTQGILEKFEGERLDIQHIIDNEKHQDVYDALLESQTSKTAVVIYTSGSTGKPKGVAITHKNLCNLLFWYTNAFNLTLTDVLPQKTTLSFVDSLVEIFLPVTLMKSCIYLRPFDAITQDSTQLMSWLKEIEVSIIQFVPSVFDFLYKNENINELTSLRILILSGEAVKNSYQTSFDIYNLYGCSECTAVSTFYKLNGSKINIGKPIANTGVYILDQNKQLLPKGAKGEIFISGSGLSCGYVNNAELTSERFIKSNLINGLLYKTGDIGRFNQDGAIEYLGRTDHQVKLRGMRIELGEIERNLVLHEEVQDAIVMLSTVGNQEVLNAYVLRAENDKDQKHVTASMSYENSVMDFSLFYFASQEKGDEYKYRLLLDTAVFADINNFQAVWLPERHFHEFGGLFPDPAVLSAALAMRTDKINLRAGSVVLPLHDELRVAEQWAVVDNLSHGRVSLSFASGWHADDFVFFPDDYKHRHKKMYEQIPLFKKLWHGGAVTRVNGLGKKIDVKIAIRPIQEDVPIWITSGGTKETFQSAGRIGANIITNLLALNIQDLAENISIYKASLTENGHDTAKVKITVMLHTYIGTDLETVKNEVKEPFKKYLSSSLGLINNLAVSRGIDLENEMTPEIKEELLEMGFERYWRTSALFGTFESCNNLVRKLYAIGVNEIACLIDFGIEYEKVMKGLGLLSSFKDYYRKETPELIREQILKAVEESKSSFEERNSQSLSEQHLKDFLSKKLPAYMVPPNFILMDKFPLTSSNKIDRRALSQIDIIGNSNYTPPTNKTEEVLISIWKEVLQKNDIGIRNKFMEMGGHSLKATRMISKVKKQLNVDIKLKDIFSYPTIEELATVINLQIKNPFKSIPVIEKKDFYDVSHSQKRMWIFDQGGENPFAYNLLHCYLLKGSLNIEAFKKSFAALISRHESLRTTFCNIHGEIKQQIQPSKTSFDIEYIYLDEDTEDKIWKLAESHIELETKRHFSFTEGPLLWVKLLHWDSDNFLFILTLHHIISDGWSMNVFFKTLFAYYNSFVTGEVYDPQELPIQYKDYADWQNKMIDIELSTQGSYWKKKLSGNIQPVNMPVDFVRPLIRTFEGAHFRFSLNEAISEQIRNFNRANDITFFVNMLALVKVLVFKYTNQDDIIIGSPVSGRNHEFLEEQIGLFLNNVVLRSTIDRSESYLSFVTKVKNTVLEAYDNMDYPYDRLVDELGPETAANRNPFYDILVVTGASDAFIQESLLPDDGSLQLQMIGHDAKISKLDLTFFFMDMDEIKIDIEYSTNLFKKETIKQIATDFELIAQAVVRNPNCLINELKNISSSENQVNEHLAYNQLILGKLDYDF